MPSASRPTSSRPTSYSTSSSSCPNSLFSGIAGIVCSSPRCSRLSVNDLADRPPCALADGDVLDLGAKSVRWIDTRHVPPGWDTGLIYEETTRMLFAGDLFTMTGRVPASTDGDIVTPAIATEDLGRASALTPASGPTLRRLASYSATRMALMRGPAFSGDVPFALGALADDFDRRLQVGLSGLRQL